MTVTLFARLTEVDDKEHVLCTLVEASRSGSSADALYAVSPDSLRQVPGAALAYWVPELVRRLFHELPAFESEGREARLADHPSDDFRYLRLAWEVPSQGNARDWRPYQKGGAFSRFYSDLHLTVDWDATRQTYRGFTGRPGRSSERPSNYQYFFRPGITWSRRTQAGLSFRALPAGCVFADKGPVAFVPDEYRYRYLSLLNSAIFRYMVSLQMAFGSYEVGVIQRTPVPDLSCREAAVLDSLARAAVDIKRQLDTANELSHIFVLPGLLQVDGKSLGDRVASWLGHVAGSEMLLEDYQREIDAAAFQLYGLPASVLTEVAGSPGGNANEISEAEGGPQASNRTIDLTADLISYAVGCVYGRWDERLCTGEVNLPSLPDPFAPLPAHSPAMLPADPRLASSPINIDLDGILVEDAESPNDIILGVRNVLRVVFEELADSIEMEACGLLGVRNLRTYFSSPRQFFARHIQAYSRSRRKAPIYWLLQSPKGLYSLWLYYHRLDKDTLFRALNSCVEPKIRLEESRFEAQQAQRASVDSGTKEARQAEKSMERQESLLVDLYEFRDRLNRAANLNLVPDLDDGVVLTMAPLWELVPWKEPRTYWEELLAGKYEWSSIGKQLQQNGLVCS